MNPSCAFAEDHVTEELRSLAPYEIRDIDLSSAEGSMLLATTTCSSPQTAGPEVSLNAQSELP